jgi:hypothetical protein
MRDSSMVASIVASLDELKSIHLERLADEQAAVARERQARLDAERAREQAARDAEAAARRAAHHAELELHSARQAAEREARLRAADAEAAERARLDLALQTEREAAERVLRRESIARQRPRWMLALTAIAIAAAVVLAVTAVQHQREANEAHERALAAEQQRHDYQVEARRAKDELASLDGEMTDLHAQIDRAVGQLAAAKTEADGKAAQAAFDNARRMLNQAAAARAEAKRRHDEIVRKAGIDASKCANTVLGCIDGK